MSASSPEKVEQLAAAMAAEREMAAGKSPTSHALFSMPDFPDDGACRLIEAAETGSLRKAGSPYWMSPEHIKGSGCGRKADIWSLGCVLVEMATATPPWHDEHAPRGQFAVFQILNKIVSSHGPPPLPDHLPPPLRRLLLACFERDVAKRPDSSSLLQLLTDV